MKARLMLLTGSLLFMQGVSFAHDGEMHMEHTDAQMARLHEIMPQYAAGQATINTALDRGDVATVVKETSYMLSTTEDLKKSKPHKKVDRIKDFRRVAGDFEKDIRATRDLARKGDLEAAKKSFSNAERRCIVCHQKFRD